MVRKKIIEKHLKNMAKAKIQKNGNLTENIIPDEDEKILEELFDSIGNGKDKKKE